MGRSGGTFIGIQAAARAPELLHAYIRVAQISDQLQSETLAYQYMLTECRKRGYSRPEGRLRKCPVTREQGTPAAYLRVRDVAMLRLGTGTMRSMKSLVSGILLPSLLCGGCSVGERVKLWAAKARLQASIGWNGMLATDLRQRITEVRVPVYFLHGVHVFTCSYTLARSYFEELTAPVKGFYTFPNSAHSPSFEEPHRTQRIVCGDIVHGSNNLADDTMAGRSVSAVRAEADALWRAEQPGGYRLRAPAP
jgi:pimeloyl-ACP methyl ester carboxylesterase